MFKKSKTGRLGEIRSDGRVAMILGRLFVAELARWTYESVDVRRRVRLSRRHQVVGLGALAAVGLATAGLVAKRAIHGSDAAAPVT
jgi:hypothetical protein